MRRMLLTGVLMAATAAAPSAAAQSVRSPRPGGDRLARAVPPADIGLRPLEGCQEVRAYLVDVTLDALIQARYYWIPLPWSGPADGSGGPSDYSSTTVQEEGVDELDIVKTDGERIVVAMDDRLRVLDSWPAAATRMVAERPIDGRAEGLFLLGDAALVVSSYWGHAEEPSWGTRLELVDLRETSSTAVLAGIEVEGSLVGARRIDGDVWAVLWTPLALPQAAWDLLWRDDLGLPEISWDATDEERAAAAAAARAILRPFVEEILRALDLGEVLPAMRRDGGAPQQLLGCGQLYRPAEEASPGVLSVLHLDLEDPGFGVDGVGVLADGFTVYASERNLYVAQTGWWWWWGWGDPNLESVVHKFQLEPTAAPGVQYRASGAVDGWILDQLAMGEHDGHLRVATSQPQWWGWGVPADTPSSAVSVLADDGQGRLVQVGRVDGIAPGEQITASRFLGERGFLVTFERVDPLFTLDLSDPAAPRVVGELEVPGFSAYLHPLEDDRLLAVGMAGEEDGTITGLAVSLFDVADLANPVLADALAVTDGQWHWSEALWDHHAVTYHREVLTMPAAYWQDETIFSGLLVVDAPSAGPLVRLGQVDHADLAPGPYAGAAAWMRRAVIIEDNLYSISDRGVKVTPLRRPDVLLATVPFHD